MSKSTKPWAPEKCPITQRPFFMWIEHHKTGEMVPTYGGPYDSYTLAEFDGVDFVCERFDHDAGGWLVDCVEGLGVKLVDDQSLVIDPNNTRYDEIEEFASAPVSAEPVAWVRRHPDGALTAEFLEHAVIEPVRKNSGAWVPLYTAPVAAQSSAPEIPPEKPLPDLMMASYHEAIGWNKCRKEMIAAYAQPDPRTPADMLVNGGALILALNALRRAGKNEIADELEKTATPAQQPVSGADWLPVKGDPWSGWACQYPGKLPRLYGDKAIAEMNHHPEEGDRLFQLAECTQQDADKVDAERYRAWRDAACKNDRTLIDAMFEYRQMHFKDGTPTPEQFNAGIDYALAAIDAARKEQA